MNKLTKVILITAAAIVIGFGVYYLWNYYHKKPEETKVTTTFVETTLPENITSTQETLEQRVEDNISTWVSLNAERWGPEKANNPVTIEMLTDAIIYCNADVVVLQEIWSSQEDVIKPVVDRLNQKSKKKYYYFISPPSETKEMVAYILAKDIKIRRQIIYPDPKKIYQRDFFGLTLQYGEKADATIINVHLAADKEAVKPQIDNLPMVFNYVYSQISDDRDVHFYGDFNKKYYKDLVKNMELMNADVYSWLFLGMLTNASLTESYDDDLSKNQYSKEDIVPNSAEVIGPEKLSLTKKQYDILSNHLLLKFQVYKNKDTD
jgi:endonuclease/exonuclease/phosphatase family metal-dependent hydrolase